MTMLFKGTSLCFHVMRYTLPSGEDFVEINTNTDNIFHGHSVEILFSTCKSPYSHILLASDSQN